MKTNLFIMLILLVLLFTPGCTTITKKAKVLSCKHKEVQQDYEVDEVCTYYFNKDNESLESYVQKMTIDYGSNSSLFSEKYQDALNLCEEWSSLSGVSCKAEKKNETLVIELGVLLSELEDDSIFGENLKDKYISYDAMKEKMENSGPSWAWV